MTTTANDSGVETSNDSNDTTLLNSHGHSNLSFPTGFDQRSLMQYTNRNELMLFGGGAASSRTAAGGGGSGSGGGVASESSGAVAASCSQQASTSTASTSTTSDPFLPPQSPPPASSSLASISAPTTPTSSSLFASGAVGGSSISSCLDLRVPVSFLTQYQPTYPAINTATNMMASPPKRHICNSEQPHYHHGHQRLKAVRLGGVVGLHKQRAGGGAPVPYIRNLSNERKLRLAASLSNVEVLLRLLDAGVNPNSADEYQRSALHLAASRGYTDVVIQLLKYGAKPNAKDSLGNTALHLAVCSASSFNFNRVVRILLKHGASVQVQDRHGKTPLDLVSARGGGK